MPFPNVHRLATPIPSRPFAGRRGRRWCLVAVMLPCLLLAAPTVAQTDNLIASIKDRGVLRVCEAAYPPYNVKNPNTNQWEGLNVDIINKLAEALHVKVQSVDSTFATLIASLSTNKCDISAAATYITPARAERVLYSLPTSYDTKTIFVPDDSKAHTYADIDKKGVTIVSRAGTAEYTYAKHFFKHATVKAVTSPATESHLLAVAGGRADAAFAGTAGAIDFLKANPNIKLRPLGDKLLSRTSFAFMLPLHEYHWQQYVDIVLNSLKSNGSLGKLDAKWLTLREKAK